MHTLETPNSSPYMPIQISANLRKSAIFHHHLSPTQSSPMRGRILLSPVCLPACGAHAEIKFSRVLPTITLTTISLSLTWFTSNYTFSIHLSAILQHKFPSHNPSRKTCTRPTFLHSRLSIQSPEDNRNPNVFCQPYSLPHHPSSWLMSVSFTEPILKEARPPFTPFSRPIANFTLPP